MAAMTSMQIFDRVSSLVAGAPYSFERAKEPFSFDLQPDQALDRAYHATIEHQQSDGYLGLAQAELEILRIHLCRKVQRDPHAVYRQLVTDISSLVSSVLLDGVDSDYNAELQGWRVPDPAPDQAFIIGMVEFTVDYDREL